ncbi:hypothetical protein [Noviherbaspirillum autotrophicum]|uniref:Uncharacterized protein n=1 Tax=Noviherbaspirillum autotrophicum TaxID=709839 RepID=A0A0C2BPL2_9BURK|nr:hypothetical protein [Noviherbaspirillum autotrophicum]KIF79971.1 hypothetical protein TSA66_02675 [Noviherbaspirillum autotrophicum]
MHHRDNLFIVTPAHIVALIKPFYLTAWYDLPVADEREKIKPMAPFAQGKVNNHQHQDGVFAQMCSFIMEM